MASSLSSFGLVFNRTRNFSSCEFITSVSSRVTACSGMSVTTSGKNMRAAQFGRRFVVKAIEAETLVQEQTGVNYDSDQPELASPLDVLTMLFQAEGTMKETAIPTVTKALEETEGVTNLKVQLLEGIASVELTKKTTIQSTGVASGLVETIQGSGFKLQTLYLSFLDEADGSD